MIFLWNLSHLCILLVKDLQAHMWKRKKYQKESDEELIALLLPQDQDLLVSLLFTRYHKLVVGVCLKYLKNIQDSEDLAMNIFHKLTDKLLRHEVTNFRSWFYTLCINECRMLLRKKKHYSLSLNESSTQIESTSDNSQEKDSLLQELESQLQTLKPDQREAIVLFYLKGMSYKVIAEHKNWEEKKVKSLVQNGKRNLKLILSTV